jgi:4-diphosphocytidyl-2-C-methyl-D-erythritol kinase
MKTALATTRLAHAKLNLRLEVGPKTGRLHPLVSAIVTLELADELAFAPARGGFSVSSPNAAIPERDNLVWRAAHELALTPPVAVTIRKHIPVQAGLGGGSADAAEMLKALAESAAQAGHPISPDALSAAAARLGSDVPAALVPGLKIVSGAGERVTSYSCSAPPWGVVLLKPVTGSDTTRAYALLDERGPRPPLGEQHLSRARAVCAAFASQNFNDFLALLHNDFTDVVESALPAVAEVRRRLERSGARATTLCGSGSCVAGLFEDAARARDARASFEVGAGEFCAVTRFHV